jgi:hypothetical protein
MSEDESKKNGHGSPSARARRVTPVVGLPTPEAAARLIAHLADGLRRSIDICDQVERLVREGGFDTRARAFMIEAADAFDVELASVASGTGRALRRLARS